jgi:CDP-glycerol glycerophosphotransferase (TagB/SpsB family)
VSTTTELMAALEDLPGLTQAFAERYAQWRARFNPLDDGRAAQRVVEQIWG